MKESTGKKPVLYTEMAYVIGVCLTMVGIAFTAHSDFGVSMVTGPSYLLHLKLSSRFPFYTFGVSQYVVQGLLLLVMCLVIRKFRISFLFSFVTAFVGGNILDLVSRPVNLLPVENRVICAGYFAIGMVLTALGIAFMFHTYISQEVYELFVQEIAKVLHMKNHVFKLYYDLASLAVAVTLMTLFFGIWPLKGIGPGTIVMAVVNGPLIGVFGSWLEKIFEIRDGLKMRSFFEGESK